MEIGYRHLAGITALSLVFVAVVAFVSAPKNDAETIEDINVRQQTLAMLSDAVAKVEFYRMNNASYPSRLDQIVPTEWIGRANAQKLEDNPTFQELLDPYKIENRSSFVGLVSSGARSSGKKLMFEYRKEGSLYRLFSVGPDLKPFTKDDVYPKLSNKNKRGIGLLDKEV